MVTLRNDEVLNTGMIFRTVSEVFSSEQYNNRTATWIYRLAGWLGKKANESEEFLNWNVDSELLGPVLHVDPAGNLHGPASIFEKNGWLVHH